MNITYTQNGDYLIPNIVIRKTKPIGHYGRLRKAYLEMHRPICFVKKSAKCDFFLNLMKKSLTFRLWQDLKIHPHFLRCPACSLRYQGAAGPDGI